MRRSGGRGPAKLVGQAAFQDQRLADVSRRHSARATFRSRRYRSMLMGMASTIAATTAAPKNQPGRMEPPTARITTAQAAILSRGERLMRQW